MFQQLLTIARNTFLESIRQPIFVVLIIAATLMLVLNPAISANTLDDDNKIMIDMGLSTIRVLCAALAAFTAAGVINQEIENRTVLTVVSKPVGRPLFILGKFVGAAAAVTLACWVLSAIFLLTVRHKVMQTASDQFDAPVLTFALIGLALALIIPTLGNYFYQWVFTSSFSVAFVISQTIAWILILFISKDWKFQSPAVDFDPQLMLGLLLVYLGLLIIVAFAVAISTRLGVLMTLMAVAVLLVVGMFSDYYLAPSTTSGWFQNTLYHLTPNLQLFWPGDALTQGNPFDKAYIGLVTGYTALLVTAMLLLGIALFQTREVG
jgi:ABC-2 type transport system permease protein